MLPSIMADPSERRPAYECRQVPTASPFQQLKGMPVITAWDNNPPEKWTHVVMRSMWDKKLYDCLYPIPFKRFIKSYQEWVHGKLIQEAFPDVPSEYREFLQTGTTPAQWNEMMKDNDVDDDLSIDNTKD